MARAMAVADLRDVLPRIGVPTLLLYGDAGLRSPLVIAGELYAQVPEVVVIAGAPHQSNIEAADRFDAEVWKFLQLRSRGS